MLVLAIVVVYLDMVKSDWDGHNGLFFHLFLRYIYIWLILILSGKPGPDASDHATLASVLLLSVIYVIHGIAENAAFARQPLSKRQGYSQAEGQEQPPEAFKLLGLCRGFVLLLVTITINWALWQL